MEAEVTRKLFTVDEYYRMGEAGIFSEDARLELIEGEILEMSPVGNRHIGCVNRATALFAARLATRAVVSVQNPILLSRYTEPQPDIVLARPREDYYGGKRISPADALLVLEVSDTTLRYDRKRKMPLYAKWGVPELWIENLENDVILVFRGPGPSGYATTLTLHRGESTALAAFPDVTFTVDELLG
jgi:Uma2 family endonuclease